MDGILPTPSANVVHMCLEVNAAKDNVGDGIVFTTEEGNTESSSSSMMTSSTFFRPARSDQLPASRAPMAPVSSMKASAAAAVLNECPPSTM